MKKIISIIGLLILCTLSACGISAEGNDSNVNVNMDTEKVSENIKNETEEKKSDNSAQRESASPKKNATSTARDEAENPASKGNEETNLKNKNNTKMELTSLLDKINKNVEIGTAGSKMKTVCITSELLNWGVGTELTNAEVRAVVVEWLVDKGNDEEVDFSKKLSLVDETYHELLGKNAKDLLDSAGCKDAAYPWSDKPIESIEAIMNAVGLRD